MPTIVRPATRNTLRHKMEYTYTTVIFLSLTFLWTSIYVLKFLQSSFKSTSSSAKLPPGPRPYPIIGNFLELGNQPHHSLAKLAKTHGALMTLKLGTITTIVISSPNTAKEVLQTHDHVLADRSPPDSARALDHHMVSMVWLPVAAHWRDLRKICAIQLFTAQRLDASQGLRRKKVDELLDYVHESCKSGQAVEIGWTAFTTSLNLLSNTFFSIDLAQYSSSNSQEFKNYVWGVMVETGRPNIADYIPVLRVIDPQGVRRRTKLCFQNLLRIFDGIIDQRLRLRASSSTTSSANNDVLDALLNLAQESNGPTLHHFKHLLMDLFIAGTDTTSSTIEWSMAELIRNPTKMAIAKNELRKVLSNGQAVQESDISSLPYLQAVIKETLRLHPPAPLLLPRQARTDVELDGYMVPKESKILVNVWAIGRDPNTWSDPNSFLPERFLESNIDSKGRNFELLPFGGGRRICPGLPLADRMVHLMLASLLQIFDWKLKNGQKPEEMDMNDKFGITLQKAEPLQAIPIRA